MGPAIEVLMFFVFDFVFYMFVVFVMYVVCCVSCLSFVLHVSLFLPFMLHIALLFAVFVQTSQNLKPTKNYKNLQEPTGICNNLQKKQKNYNTQK